MRSELGYPVPYFQDGKGPCSGLAAEAEPAGGEASEKPTLPMRTFAGWVAGLGSDPWDAAAFTFAILSGGRPAERPGGKRARWLAVLSAWAACVIGCGQHLSRLQPLACNVRAEQVPVCPSVQPLAAV